MASVKQDNMLYLGLLIEAECSKMETLLAGYVHVYSDQGNHYPGHTHNETLDILLSEIKSTGETIERLASGGG